MDPKLQGPLKALAEALHQAIARSVQVENALKAVKNEGFQAALWLEVTVSLSRADADAADESKPSVRVKGMEAEEAADDDGAQTKEIERVERPADAARAEADGLSLRIAPEDREFLRSLRIRIED